MAKNRKYHEPVNWKKELRLAPGYLILLLWISFTFVLLGWVLLASFSTTKEIFSNKLLASGLHFENYVKAWINSDVAGIFRNSLIYSMISCVLLIIICAPAAYVLARFVFPGNKLIQTGFVSAMGVPVVMIVLPLFGIVANLGILNHVLSNSILLIFLYIGINVPYTTIFLMTFFGNLSRAFEEAAAIDGASFSQRLFLVVLPLMKPAIATVCIINFITCLNNFFTPLYYSNGIQVLSVAIVQLPLRDNMYGVPWDLVSSMGWIILLPIIIFVAVFEKQIMDGIMAGGVKA